jgi:hypothetical protein
MQPFTYLGREISVDGVGVEEDPFIVRGTGFNPALAAELESHILNLCFAGAPWYLVDSRLKKGSAGEQLAILKIRYFSPENDTVQSEVWFDVSEAFGNIIE